MCLLGGYIGRTLPLGVLFFEHKCDVRVGDRARALGVERRPLEQAEARGGAERDEQLAVAEGLGDDAVLVVRAVA